MQNILKGKLKKEYTNSSRTEENATSQAPSSTILRAVLCILDIEIELSFLKGKFIQGLLNPTNALWKDFMRYRLNVIINSNQGFALFRQKQILRSNRNKKL